MRNRKPRACSQRRTFISRPVSGRWFARMTLRVAADISGFMKHPISVSTKPAAGDFCEPSSHSGVDCQQVRNLLEVDTMAVVLVVEDDPLIRMDVASMVRPYVRLRR